MKKIISLALITLSLTTGSVAAPFMAIGDGAELFVTGTLGVRADDNIFLTANEEDDLIFDIIPGAELTFGKDSQLQGALTAAVAISSYSDNNDLNTELFSSSVVSRFDDGKLKLNLNASYSELNQNSVDIRGLTRRDVFAARGDAEVEVSPLMSVAGGIAFNHENYKRAGFTDSDSLTVPLNLYYQWTEKADVSFGYRYRDYEVDLGQDSTDQFFSIGARGEFTPKVTGTFAIGWNTRDLNGGGEEDGFGLDSSFAYEVSPKTSLQLGASRDFGTSPQGAQQTNTTVNVSVINKLNAEWTTNFGGSYRQIDYGTRSDDYSEFQAGATYIVNAHARIVGAYVRRDYKTKLAGGDFENNVFSIAANLRY